MATETWHETADAPSLGFGILRRSTSYIHAVVPRAFGGTEVHRTSVFFRLTHHTLEALGRLARGAQASNQKGLLGLIFNKLQNKFDSAHPWSSAFGRAARAQF